MKFCTWKQRTKILFKKKKKKKKKEKKSFLIQSLFNVAAFSIDDIVFGFCPVGRAFL